MDGTAHPEVRTKTPEPPMTALRWPLCLALLLIVNIAGRADEPTDFPGVRRLPAPVRAKHGMIASAHPLASRAGVEVLQAGGNAIDATLAVQAVLNVVEPQFSGIGGGCFLVYYDAKTRQTHCLDGREETPAAARREDFLDAAGKVKADAMTGGAAVGVPGTVAALWQAHGRWGKLPVARLLEPAIRLAEDGFGVTPGLRVDLEHNLSRVRRFPATRAAFLRPDGSLPEVGDLLKQPDLARTFRLLADQGPKTFYEGEIARDIVLAVHGAAYQPGRLSLDDLRNYRAVPREPVRFTYGKHEVVSMPPPSSGGPTLGLILGLLEESRKREDANDKYRYILQGIEFLRDSEWRDPDSRRVWKLWDFARFSGLAFADRNAYLGDADWSPDVPMRRFLDRTYHAARLADGAKLEPGERAAPGRLVGNPPPAAKPQKEGRHTTHFSIVDADRNVVSCTSTIENGMGSGVVVPGRGFLLNNELTDFDLSRTDGPNALDSARRPRRTALTDNTLPAGKRPRSSMTPVVVFADGKPYLTLGSPGGPFIIGVVAQVLLNLLDEKMDMQQALSAPRLSNQNDGVMLEVLHKEYDRLVRELTGDPLRVPRQGWVIKKPGSRHGEGYFGNAQGIRLLSDGTLEGGSDPRGEGASRGY
jgi:gamma-glutamyltranspeptidase / glutathione hydrolase